MSSLPFARKSVGKNGRKNAKQHERASVIWEAATALLAARGFATRRSYVTLAVTLIFPTDFRAKERLLAV